MTRLSKVIDGKKVCNRCLKLLDISLFGTYLDVEQGKRYYLSRCKKCKVLTAKDWVKNNLDRHRANIIRKREILLDKIRVHYGNKCSCCGEENKLFLTIDHINNDGYKLRPRNNKGKTKALFSHHYYKDIIKHNFPTDLQLLCWNCNCGRQRNKGICPHKNGNNISTKL